MKNSIQTLTRLAMVLGLSLTAGIASATQDGSTAVATNPWQSCKAKAGVAAGAEPTQDQLAKIRECRHAEHEARQAAFAKCAAASGITLTAGQKPSEEQHLAIETNKDAIHACMAAAGFKGHHRHQADNN